MGHRPSPRIEFWSRERYRISDALELIRLGGSSQAATVCLWRDGTGGRGALLSGHIIQVVADRDWVSFMWSYPEPDPAPGGRGRAHRDVFESLTFDRLYGAWWDRVVPSEAQTKVLRSADRNLNAISRWRGHAEL